ncbi:MAG TPA: hypothetical protein VNU68_21540 [Verrucomicrobiae bacterium]|nr:hypothetical protein [Verrucomicrobiae bacterium]
MSPQGRLLVFVHGFKGSAVDTWGGFPEQLCLHNEAKGYDLVCFGYDSARQTAGESANQLQKFLNELLFNTARVVNRSIEEYDSRLRRESKWNYKAMVIVGHSLGACISRRAMLNQLRSGTGRWPERTKLVWFAPAHCGARLFRLVTAATLGVSLEFIDGVAAFAWPVLKDLQEDSKFLEELREHTEELQDNTPNLCSPLTFWAWKDKVVINGCFGKDKTPFEEIRGASHVSICKPTGNDKTVRLLLKELVYA